MKPNTFIIGAPKAGTTALAAYLGDHPDVFFSVPKEPFFWSTDIPESKHELRPRTLDEYCGLFDGADPSVHRVVAEGSTRYLRSTVAVPKILSFNPEARIIVSIRNPVEFVQAFHMEQVYVHQEDVASFDEAWALQERRERGLNMPANSVGADYVLYRQVGSFARQLERVRAVVPPGQLHVILFDDFSANPGTVWRELCAFLGIDPGHRTTFEPVNSSHAQRFPALTRALLHPPARLVIPMRQARKWMLDHPDLPGLAAVKSMLNVKRERQAPSPETLEDVRAHFAPEVERLAHLLGRDLSHWLALTRSAESNAPPR